MRDMILNSQIQEALTVLDEIYMSGSCLSEFAQDLILEIREQMYEELDKNAGLASKLSQVISLFYELKQKFHDSGLMRQTLEVFIIQSQNVFAGATSAPSNSASSSS